MLNDFVAALLALVGFVVILVVLLTLPVYFLWNWVGVDVLHLPSSRSGRHSGSTCLPVVWQALHKEVTLGTH